jgi:hypothetical protein
MTDRLLYPNPGSRAGVGGLGPGRRPASDTATSTTTGSSGYITIEDGSGVKAPPEPIVQFANSTVVDDPANTRTIVTIPSSGGSATQTGLIFLGSIPSPFPTGLVVLPAPVANTMGATYPGTVPGTFQIAVPPDPAILEARLQIIAPSNGTLPTGVAATDIVTGTVSFGINGTTFQYAETITFLAGNVFTGSGLAAVFDFSFPATSLLQSGPVDMSVLLNWLDLITGNSFDGGDITLEFILTQTEF